MSLALNGSGRVVYTPATTSTAETILAAPGLIVVLCGILSPAALDAVWKAVARETRTLEGVVQSIPLLGPGAVESFAVAAVEGDGQNPPMLTLVVRGDTTMDIFTRNGRRRLFSSRGLQPWNLASFRDTTGLSFPGATGQAAIAESFGLSGTELALESGVVRASAVAWVFDEDSVVVREPMTAAAGLSEEAEITLERPFERRSGRHTGLPEGLHPAPAVRLLPRAGAAEPNLTPRRRLSRVRIGAGAPFELHVPVFIGRRPRGPRQLPLGQVILFEVPSPTREVSASHLRIEQRGSEVVVTDLRSTNGTAVTLPGAPRIKLGQGDSIVVPPYSRIDIGDGNVIEILPGVD